MLIASHSKKCSHCKKFKPLDLFYKNRCKKDGFGTMCKICLTKSRVKHRDKYTAYQNIWRRKKRATNPAWRAYDSLQRHSRRKNILRCTLEEFTLWYNNQSKICEYCGIDEKHIITIIPNQKQYIRLEIDRKNNDKGYSIDNMCLACRHCNVVKNNVLSHKEMKFIGKEFIKPKHDKIIGGVSS